MRPLHVLLAAVAALLAMGNQAVAESCRDAAERLAQNHGLQWPQPPATMESRGMTETDELAPSQGVIEPPAGDDDMVMDAPQTGSDMPTALGIVSPQGEDTAGELTAEQRSRMEALLAEAVRAVEEGEPARCFERLGAAEAIPEEQP